MDALFAAPGLPWLVAAALLGGLVRGFSGFGTAMVFLPVAARWVGPFEAITLLIAMDLIGPLPNVPRAVRDGDPPDILRLVAGLCIGLPLGVALLGLIAPEVFRWGISLVALGLLVLLAGGMRYDGALTPAIVRGIGAAAGVLGGVAGMAGPPVILFYMASSVPVATIRANVLLFLVASDVVMLGVLWLFGHLAFGMLGLGLLLALPYLLGNVVGAALFRPDRAALYRGVGYGLIALSAVSGLPVLD